MNNIQEFRFAHSNHTGFCDNCMEPSGSIKCGEFHVAVLVFQEEICCLEMVNYAYASI